MKYPLDLTGVVFGKYVVLGLHSIVPVGNKPGDTRTKWLCRCDCGAENVVGRGSLTKENGSKSCSLCACVGRAPANKTHGMSKTRTFTIWSGMKKRCYNKNATYYDNYGGRGIIVCDRWLNSFENFLADMGECPEGLTLERKETNGNYEPSNCKWATRKEQNRNTRANRMLTHDGQTRCLGEWAEITGIGICTIKRRIDTQGWSVEKALTEPLGYTSKTHRIIAAGRDG